MSERTVRVYNATEWIPLPSCPLGTIQVTHSPRDSALLTLGEVAARAASEADTPLPPRHHCLFEHFDCSDHCDICDEWDAALAALRKIEEGK